MDMRKNFDTAKHHLDRAVYEGRRDNHAGQQAHALTCIAACLFACLAAQQEPEAAKPTAPESPVPTADDEADMGGLAFERLPRTNLGPLHPEMAELCGVPREFAIGHVE